jgi:hypothetical protein
MTVQGIVLGFYGGTPGVWSIGTAYRGRERRVFVSSHRANGRPLADLRNENVLAALRCGVPDDPDMPLYAEAGDEFMRRVSDTLTWETVSIPVESVLTPFAVAQVGEGWAAIGEGPLSIITVAAHNVALDEISLVRLSDLRYLNPRLPRRRPPRARRFPDRHLAPAVILGVEANMDLQYAQGRLVGTYNGNRVDIELDGPAHRARVSGIFAGLPMSVNWRLGGSSSQHHSTLHGRFADSTLTLTGEFHINGSIVQSASLSGRFAGVPIEAVIEAADGGSAITGRWPSTATSPVPALLSSRRSAT